MIFLTSNLTTRLIQKNVQNIISFVAYFINKSFFFKNDLNLSIFAYFLWIRWVVKFVIKKLWLTLITNHIFFVPNAYYAPKLIMPLSLPHTPLYHSFYKLPKKTICWRHLFTIKHFKISMHLKDWSPLTFSKLHW